MASDNTPFLDLSEIVRHRAWDRVARGYAEVIASQFEHYARDALELSEVGQDDLVLDVACGPGTLARLAARITKVHALDFSSQMLEEVRNRANADELRNLELRQGDGQALPYDDGSFSAVFSMFGLFMFPDRARGFAELARVLQPGGRAVVASWQPQDEIRPFMIINEALAEEVEEPHRGPPPLADPDVFAQEMTAAGFEVEVRPSTHTLESGSLDELWLGLERAHVALGIAHDQLAPERYAAMIRRIRDRMRAELGEGPQALAMPAWLALGRI